MSEFPCFEVLSAPQLAHLSVAAGTRIPLAQGLEIGRSLSGVPLGLPTVAKRHARVEFRHSRWWVFDLGSEHGTYLNGARVFDGELAHQDILEFPWGYVFQVLLRDPALDSILEMEAELLRFPDDEERWQVWADWAMERGLPLGRQLSGEPLSLEEQARVLRTAAVPFRLGFVEPQWHRGFPVRVVLRDPGRSHAYGGASRLLELVLRENAFRFLKYLEVDLLSFSDELSPAEDVFDDLLALLTDLDGPRWLESLRLGPAPSLHVPAGQAARYHRVLERYPSLTTPLERLIFNLEHASLEVQTPTGSQTVSRPRSIGLSSTEPNVIARVDDATLHIDSPTALQVTHDGRRWVLEVLTRPPHLVRVNGREVSASHPLTRAHLRNGDLIEIASGPTFRFRMH